MSDKKSKTSPTEDDQKSKKKLPKTKTIKNTSDMQKPIGGKSAAGASVAPGAGAGTTPHPSGCSVS